MKSANDMTCSVYCPVVELWTPPPHAHKDAHEHKEERGRGEEREIDKAGLRPLICPQKSCLFRGNDTCGRGGNDQLGPM